MTAALDPAAILIRGSRIIDPARNVDGVGDVLIRDGSIASANGFVPSGAVPDGSLVIEAQGLVTSPGFIDLHCHLREPGFEYKETIATGAAAAACGGFTTICCMPNTEPAIDSAAVVDYIHHRVAAEAAVRVLPIGCVSRGRHGKELADMEELAAAGVVAFSDDGDPVYDDNLMRLALTYSRDLGLPISNHCQEHSLSRYGVMAEGWTATRLGLPGIPAAAEETMIARDISLAELSGGRLHVAHLSTAGSVSLIRDAKERGIPVTAEVCPHHLTINDRWALGGHGEGDIAGAASYDTSTKVYPPLRQDRDVEALIEGLASGVIDCVATDHAPHDIASKEVTYQDAAFGISVLETALGSLMGLVHTGRITLPTLIERLTAAPARILGADYLPLAILGSGTPADVVVFDPSRQWTVDTTQFASKGKNTPLEGTVLTGAVLCTIAGGQVAYQDPTVAVSHSNSSPQDR